MSSEREERREGAGSESPEVTGGRYGRRGFIGRVAAVGAAAALGESAVGAVGALGAPQAKAARSSVAPGNVLRVLRGAEFGSFDPANYRDAMSMDAIYEGLVCFKPGTNKIVNCLAESIDVSKDGKSIAFKLKRGIPFHKGFGEVTANDVKYSYERIAGIQKLYPDATSSDASGQAGQWAALERVQVTGKYAGVIRLKRPFGPLFTQTLPWPAGYVVSKKAVAKYGRAGWPTNPIGTGPYEQLSYQVGVRQELKRFAKYGGASSDYWPKYQWAGMTFLLGSVGPTREIALEAGDVDFLPASGINPNLLKLITSGKFNFLARANISFINIAINLANPKFADVRVRQAIRLAIDQRAVTTASTGNANSMTFSPVPQSVGIGYWKDAPRYKQNVAQAKQLLAAAGASNLEVTLGVEGDSLRAAGEVVQANLAEAGIKVNIIIKPPKDYSYGPSAIQKQELFLNSYGYNLDPNDFYSSFSCDQREFWNYWRWCNPQFDALAVKAATASNPAVRSKMYIQLAQMMDKAAGFVYLYRPATYTVAQKPIKITAYPFGISDTPKNARM